MYKAIDSPCCWTAEWKWYLSYVSLKCSSNRVANYTNVSVLEASGNAKSSVLKRNNASNWYQETPSSFSSTVFIILNVISTKILLKTFQLKNFQYLLIQHWTGQKVAGLPAIISFVYSVGFKFSIHIFNNYVFITTWGTLGKNKVAIMGR